MEIFPLYEGSFSVDASKKFIPFDPQLHDNRDRPGSLFVHINPFLVQTGNELILFDAGLGYRDTHDELFIHQRIRQNGFEPEDVSLVLLSHLHYDHSGGLVRERNGALEPSFPRAVHVVQRGEWEAALAGSSSTYHREIFSALDGSVEIQLVEGAGELRQGIRYEHSGGHSPSHQVFWLDLPDGKCFYGGDELPEPEQLLRRFIAKYDFDGRRAMQLREAYGKEAAAGDYNCLFYHAKSSPVGKVRYENEQFKVFPAA